MVIDYSGTPYLVEGPFEGGPTNLKYYDIYSADGWFSIPRGRKRERILRKYKTNKKAYPMKPINKNTEISREYIFEHLAPATNQLSVCTGACVPKRSTNMYNEMQIREVTDESRKVQFLLEELHDERDNKVEDLRRKYGIDQTYPKNRKELAEWLKTGKFLIEGLDKPDKAEEDIEYWNIRDKIRFTSVPQDDKGFVAAYDLLMVAYNKARVQISVLSPVDGLKVLEAFQAS